MHTSDNTKNNNDSGNDQINNSSDNIQPIRSDTHKNSETEPEGGNYKPDNKEKSKFKLFSNWEKQDVIQVIIAAITVAALITSVIFNIIQVHKTNKALDRADTANFYSREANRLTEKSVTQAKIDGEESDALNRKAIEIAESSLNVSSKIAEMQEEFTKKELRAYINISDIKLTNFTPNKDVVFTIEYINVGKTPAYKMKFTGTYKIGGTGVYENEINAVNNSTDFSPYAVKGAGLKGFVDIPKSGMDSLRFNRIKKGDVIMYIYGTIIYTDIFFDTHRTTYCMQYFPSDKVKLCNCKNFNDAN